MKEEINIDSDYFKKSDFYFTEQFTGFEEIYRGDNSSTVIYMAVKGLKKFTIKALKKEFRSDPFYIVQLRKEFEIGYLLDSPHIARYYAFEEIEGYGPCIVREWIDGKPLSLIIKEGKTNLNDYKRVVLEICETLEYLHVQGIVHQDLKPSNILVTNDGKRIKLIDFGFSDSSDFNSFKLKGGTKEFASPEQYEAEDFPVGFHSDIYSLGKILELLPVSKERGARRLIDRMVSYNPDRRPDLKEIKKYLSSENHRNFNLLILATFLTLSGLCVMGLLYLIGPTEKERSDPEKLESIESIYESENTPTLKEKDNLDIFNHVKNTPEQETFNQVASGIISPQRENEIVSAESLEDPQPDREKRTDVHPLEIITYNETLELTKKFFSDPATCRGWKHVTREEVKARLKQNVNDNEELQKKCYEAIELGLNEFETKIEKENNPL